MSDRDGDRERGRAERERARDVADTIREATREAARERAEAAREVAEAALDAGRDQAELAREMARSARDAVREVARHGREIARAARDAARDAVRDTVRQTLRAQTIVLSSPDFSAPVEKAMVVMHDMQRMMDTPLASASEGLDRAEADLAQQAANLAAMQAGDFSDVVVTQDGVKKCGDVSKREGCQPLSDDDKAELRDTMTEALAQAHAGITEAREGLLAAQQALNGAP